MMDADLYGMGFTIKDTELSILNMRRRMPFHFGNVHVTEGPQVSLIVEATVDGNHATGHSMGALAPMWFYKDPDMTLEDGIDAMLDTFKVACDHAETNDTSPTVFEFWRSLYDAVHERGADAGIPALLSTYGVSLVEQAAIDAFCRATGSTFPDAIAENALGIELGVVYEELDGQAPTDLLPDTPSRSTAVRHTVGLSDPLMPAEIPPEDRLDDGLPQALSKYIGRQGTNHFKIKLAAAETDLERLVRIARVVEDSSLCEYAFTLDANEQYPSITAFREYWERMVADKELAAFLNHLLYVEQPLPRDAAFGDDVRRTLDDWDDHPPIIIDESDDEMRSLATALDCGYAGTSHKNCKGVINGIANRCLIAHRHRTDDGDYLISGEDLTTLGPVELQQDLAVMAVLGIEHVERNGHHYYQGLNVLSDDVQADMLAAHDDLYHRHGDGFLTLDIRDGQIHFDSVLDAPFGYAVDTDSASFVPADEWEVESTYER